MLFRSLAEPHSPVPEHSQQMTGSPEALHLWEGMREKGFEDIKLKWYIVYGQ